MTTTVKLDSAPAMQTNGVNGHDDHAPYFDSLGKANTRPLWTVMKKLVHPFALLLSGSDRSSRAERWLSDDQGALALFDFEESLISARTGYTLRLALARHPPTHPASWRRRTD